MTTAPLKIGFIGLGIMGTPMAMHLISAGHPLFAHTRSKMPETITATATACSSASDVAEKADIIFIMVPDTPDVEKVLFGQAGVAGGLKKTAATGRKVVIDLSSISPIATKNFAKK